MAKVSRVVHRLSRPLLGGVLVVGVSVIPLAPAQARATVTRFFGTVTSTFTAPLEGCLPQDLVGSATVTETSTGQVVETGRNVIAVHGVNTYDYRLEFPNGGYVQSGLNRDHYAFVANGAHGVYTVVTQDLRTIYAADGTPVGSLSIHADFHLTYTDLNGNGAAELNEVTVQFENFRLRCR